MFGKGPGILFATVMFKQIGRDRCPGRERAAMTRVVVGTAARVSDLSKRWPGMFLMGLLELFGCPDQGAADAGFHGRMPGVGNDDVIGFRPSPSQCVGGNDRANHVVSSLNDDAGKVADTVNVFQKLIVA